mmetsp:Transcript_6249/g.25868  ORF Transcript_6249/g.25868 Transcript_6249/m.25868 type:complete len:396 (+) Transcript_6249:183-1370(+)
MQCASRRVGLMCRASMCVTSSVRANCDPSPCHSNRFPVPTSSLTPSIVHFPALPGAAAAQRSTASQCGQLHGLLHVHGLHARGLHVPHGVAHRSAVVPVARHRTGRHRLHGDHGGHGLAVLGRVGRRVARSVDGGDVVDGAAPLVLLVQGVEPDEVLLRVGRNLRGGPGDDEVAADGSPVALPELGEAEEEEAVLLLGPGDALATLLIGGLRGGSLAPLLLGGGLAAVGPAGVGLGRGRGRGDGRGVILRGRDDPLGVQHAILVLVVREGHAAGLDVLDVLLQEVESALEANHGLAGDVGAELAPHVVAVEVANLSEGRLEVLVLVDGPVLVRDDAVDSAHGAAAELEAEAVEGEVGKRIHRRHDLVSSVCLNARDGFGDVPRAVLSHSFTSSSR